MINRRKHVHAGRAIEAHGENQCRCISCFQIRIQFTAMMVMSATIIEPRARGSQGGHRRFLAGTCLSCFGLSIAHSDEDVTKWVSK